MLFALNRQRYYGYLIHLGLAIVITGIVGSQSGRIEVQRQLSVGRTMQVGGYTLRLEGLEALPGPDKMVVAAPVAVFAGDGTASAGSPDSTGAIELLRPSAFDCLVHECADSARIQERLAAHGRSARVDDVAVGARLEYVAGCSGAQ